MQSGETHFATILTDHSQVEMLLFGLRFFLELKRGVGSACGFFLLVSYHLIGGIVSKKTIKDRLWP